VRLADTPRLLHAAAPAAAAACGSLLLSAAAVRATPLLNNDGIVYLQAAEAFARGGNAAAQAVHAWPFYPGLIAALSAALGMSLETAAHVLGAALLALASAAFVLAVRELLASPGTQWLAVAVVLSHPGLNRFRPLVVRDFGTCAFALLAVVLVLRYDRRNGLPLAVAWALVGAIAVLFRPEAALLVAAAPFALLADGELPFRLRAVRALKLAAVPLFGLAAVGGWLMSSPAAARALETGLAPFVQPLTAGLRRGADGLARSFPLPHGREYAPYILLWGLLVVPVVKMLKVSGLVHAGLGAYGLLGRDARPVRTGARRVLAALTASAILTLYGFLLKQLFVETRYALLASLLLCVGAPFALAALLARRGSSRVIPAVVGAALLFSLAVGFRGTGTGDEHIAAALAWLRERTPGSARLYTNSIQVAYYSRRAVSWEEVYRAIGEERFDPAAVARSDYSVLRFGPGDVETARRAAFERSGVRAVRSFENAAGERVIVYQRAPLADGGIG